MKKAKQLRIITRTQLHQIIEELPDGELATAERVLSALLDTAEPAREWHIDEAPDDDEPLTEEEVAEVLAAEARIAAGGKLIPHEEAQRLLLEEP